MYSNFCLAMSAWSDSERRAKIPGQKRKKEKKKNFSNAVVACFSTHHTVVGKVCDLYSPFMQTLCLSREKKH